MNGIELYRHIFLINKGLRAKCLGEFNVPSISSITLKEERILKDEMSIEICSTIATLLNNNLIHIYQIDLLLYNYWFKNKKVLSVLDIHNKNLNSLLNEYHCTWQDTINNKTLIEDYKQVNRFKKVYGKKGKGIVWELFKQNLINPLYYIDRIDQYEELKENKFTWVCRHIHTYMNLENFLENVKNI